MTERYDTFRVDGQDYMMDNQRTELPPYMSLPESTLQLLAILPVVTGLLSFLASLAMITSILKGRVYTSWTTYHGLMTAMGMCNILFAMTMLLSSFMYDRETSFHIWAVGNESTCTMIGFLNQFCNASILGYMMCLSIYFLLSTRYELSNEHISRMYESRMHALCLAFALATSFGGLFLDAYGERSETIGCWVRNCDFDDNGFPVNCLQEAFMHVAGRWWSAVVLFVMSTVAILIGLHFRKRVQQQERKQEQKQGRNKQMANFLAATDDETNEGDQEDVNLSIRRELERGRKENEKLLRDKRRLRRLRIQSLCFVVAFICCTIPTNVVRFSRGHPFFTDDFPYVGYMEIPYNSLQLVLIQALLMPMLPFFISLIYMWPKYVSHRKHFNLESRWWVTRRTVFGSSVQPTPISNS